MKIEIKKDTQVYCFVFLMLFLVVGCGDGGQALSFSMTEETSHYRSAKKVSYGSFIEIHYTLKDAKGQVLDSTYDRGQLFRFTIGSGSVSSTLQKGILGMRVKQKKKIEVPAGEVTLSPAPKWLDPKNILTYEVKVMKIRGR